MIISKTPYRISLVGGGTDLPAFYEANGFGAVVSFTINKYMYIAVNRKFDKGVRVSYSETENVVKADKVHHDLARESLSRLGIKNNIEIVSIGDIPGKGTGLGSSSAYAVGLVNALTQYCIRYQIPFEPIKSLAETACEIEIDRCGKPIGKQDQYACSYGGFNHLVFHDTEEVEIKRLALTGWFKNKIEERMVLFYTGITHNSSMILEEQAEGLRVGDAKKEIHLRMRDVAVEMYQDLLLGNIDNLGEMLDENWLLKRRLAYGITTPEIDDWYTIGKDNGAVGGKLCGAGGGGFLLFVVDPEDRERLIESMPLKYVPFKIESKGSRIVLK